MKNIHAFWLICTSDAPRAWGVKGGGVGDLAGHESKERFFFFRSLFRWLFSFVSLFVEVFRLSHYVTMETQYSTWNPRILFISQSPWTWSLYYCAAIIFFNPIMPWRLLDITTLVRKHIYHDSQHIYHTYISQHRGQPPHARVWIRFEKTAYSHMGCCHPASHNQRQLAMPTRSL